MLLKDPPILFFDEAVRSPAAALSALLGPDPLALSNLTDVGARLGDGDEAHDGRQFDAGRPEADVGLHRPSVSGLPLLLSQWPLLTTAFSFSSLRTISNSGEYSVSCDPP